MNENNPNKQTQTESADNRSNGRRRLEDSVDLGREEEENGIGEQERKKEDEVTWRSLPKRSQLVILTLARLSEPLVQTSLQSYMFYQLKWMDESLPNSVIAAQAGMLASCFTGAQFLTAMMWGSISDSERGGRKMVILIGLFGTMLSVLGFGFSKTFWQAAVSRTLGGALNGNIGVMRTMISEIVQEKKYQSRAFLLFPICFNIGVIVGPIMGGLLADPANSYPSVFGHIEWLQKFPYALPNIVSAALLLSGTLGVFFGLNETLDSIRHKEDLGTKCRRKIVQLFSRRKASDYSHSYEALSNDDNAHGTFREDVELSSPTSPEFKQERRKAVPRWKRKLPFRRIFTYNVVCTLCAHFLLATHLGTFNNLWFVFLSTPVADPKHPYPSSFKQRLPFIFTGGLGMPPRDVGFAMAILGVIGIAMQLFIYPIVNARFGTVKSWRIFLYCFPIAYVLVPYLAIIPSETPAPAKKDGILVWVSLCLVLFIQVTGRTFALPATTILVNNASPHPSVLGTIHGIGQSCASAGRAIGPTVGGALYGVGLQHGVVGGVWWGLSGLALANCIASLWVREGDGHEIVLEGDREAEAEFQASIAEDVGSAGSAGSAGTSARYSRAMSRD